MCPTNRNRVRRFFVLLMTFKLLLTAGYSFNLSLPCFGPCLFDCVYVCVCCGPWCCWAECAVRNMHRCVTGCRCPQAHVCFKDSCTTRDVQWTLFKITGGLFLFLHDGPPLHNHTHTHHSCKQKSQASCTFMKMYPGKSTAQHSVCSMLCQEKSPQTSAVTGTCWGTSSTRLTADLSSVVHSTAGLHDTRA